MRVWMALGAINGFIGVACGAFAAHGLDRAGGEGAAAPFRTASSYELIHALALLAVAWAASRAELPARRVRVAGVAFALGCLLFSGSLYLYALTGVRWLAFITPMGGAAFLIGWGALGLAVVPARKG